MSDRNPAYTAEDFSLSLAAADYIARFRDEERFAHFCRECPNYGRSWGCPPFGFDVAGRLGRYSHILLTATRIRPATEGLPMSMSRELIRPERIRLDSRLRELERLHGGLSCSYVGSCLYCPEGSCTRPSGLPCRHPDMVRPSLEAYGFDIGRTLSELFGIEILWGRDGLMPEYLTLVCGLFHNGGGSVCWQPAQAECGAGAGYSTVISSI